MLSTLRRAAITLLASALVTSCSERTGGNAFLPQHAVVPGQSAPLRLSSSTSFSSFASMVGKDIAAADIDRFIDPSITGPDRQLARQLMWSMPKNMRGDFVYIERSGKLLSNRPEIAASMALEHYQLPEHSSSGSGRRPLYYPSQGPPVTTGAYIKEFSLNGVTALIADVRVDCYKTIFQLGPAGSPDKGFLYSGGSGMDGSSVDAGLQYNNDWSIQPFVSGVPTSTQQWTNQSQHYACNTQTVGNTNGTLGIFFGEMTSGTMLFLATGVPEYPPSPSGTFPSTVNWDDGAWVYFPTPGNWHNPGTDANGQSTVCTGCYTKRVTSIGQEGGVNFANLSCFGCLDPPYAHIQWGPIEMGQIVDPCPVNVGAPATTCSIQGWPDGRWFGGLQAYPTSVITIGGNDETATQALEGIFMDPPTPMPSSSPDPTPDPNPTDRCRIQCLSPTR